MQVEGGGDPEYARELGREGLDSVLGRDSMKSLADGASSRRELAGHSLVGLSSLVYNFGEWTYQGDDLKRFEVRVTDASAFPMNSLLSAAGFMEALVDRLAGFRIHVSIERPDADSVVFEAAPV